MTAPDQMPPGRDLDQLVAERVFDLTIVSTDWPCGREPECGEYAASLYADYQDGDGEWFKDRGPVTVRRADGWPPRPDEYESGRLAAIVSPVAFYSTDLVAMFDVIAHWSGDVDLRRQNGLWHAEFFKPSRQWSAWADTAPLAVCRAALKSVADAPLGEPPLTPVRQPRRGERR